MAHSTILAAIIRVVIVNSLLTEQSLCNGHCSEVCDIVEILIQGLTTRFHRATIEPNLVARPK